MHRDHFFPLPITPTRECHQGCCASTRELSVSISPSLATSCCCRSVAAHGGADQAHVLSAQRWQQWEELVWILSVLSWKDADAYLNPDQGVLLIPLSMRPGLCYFPTSISPTAIQTVLLFLRADLGAVLLSSGMVLLTRTLIHQAKSTVLSYFFFWETHSAFIPVMEETRYEKPSGMLFAFRQCHLNSRYLVACAWVKLIRSMLGDGWHLFDSFGNYRCFIAWLVSASAHRHCQPCPLTQAACGGRDLALNPPPSHSSLHSHACGESVVLQGANQSMPWSNTGQSLHQLLQKSRSFLPSVNQYLPASPRPPCPLLALKRDLFPSGLAAGPSASPAKEILQGCRDWQRSL